MLRKTTSQFQTEQQSTKPRFSYIFEGPQFDERFIVFSACEQGDLILLNMVFDHHSNKLSEKFRHVKIEIETLRECSEKLIRQKEILEIQRSSIEKYASDFSNHLDEIDVVVSTKLLDLLNKSRIQNRNRLKTNSKIIIGGQAHILDLAKRVKLHQEFSKKIGLELENMRIDLENSDPEPLLKKLADNLKSIEIEIKRINQKNSLSEQELLVIQSQLKIIKEISQGKHLTVFIQELTEMHPGFVLDLNHRERLTKLCNITEISLETLDQNGNNLLHRALFHGQFKTAEFLLSRGINYKHKNAAGLIAIDSQDLNGNTLLHFYILEKNFENVCNIVLQGASCSIQNNAKSTIFDFSVDSTNLIHFLLKKLSEQNYDQKYLQLFNHFVSHHLKISHLLTQNESKQSAFESLLNLPEKLKLTILTLIRQKNLEKIFKSPFQAYINFALWEHFDILIKEHSYNACIKIALSIIQGNMKSQLEFLSNLQVHIIAARDNKTDIELYNFIIDQLGDIGKAKEKYTHYLRTLQNQYKNPHTVPESESYYLSRKHHDLGEYYLDSTYKKVKKALFADTMTSTLHDTPLTAKIEDIPSFTSPLKNTKRYAKLNNNIDPLHWFSQPRNASYSAQN